jgi:NAD(P)-dependent dehydrogenase (short-subunit alcohol dehydrogenase family)
VVRRPDSLADAEAMLDAALATFGQVDQLVVASGLNKPGFIHELDYEDWQAVMDANVRGIWFMAKAVGAYWIERKVRGKVLLMSSVRGRHGNFSGYTGYCASKGATDALTRVLATEWAKYGITVNAIAPTVFRSKLTAWMYGDNELGQQTRARSLSRIPLGRLGEVEDLVGMATIYYRPCPIFVPGKSCMSMAAIPPANRRRAACVVWDPESCGALHQNKWRSPSSKTRMQPTEAQA